MYLRFFTPLPKRIRLICACSVISASAQGFAVADVGASFGRVYEADLVVAKRDTVDISGQVYQVVEQMPEFPGGMEAQFNYLAQNVKYPAVALDSCIQGRVVVSFTVDTDGSIVDPKVVKSVHPLLDDEAKRVIQTMPKWIPGKQNGTVVKVKYSVPVAFRIVEDKTAPVASSNQTDSDVPVVKPKTRIGNLANKVILSPECKASYPGGSGNMFLFIKALMKYPEQAKNQGLQGVAFVSCIVEQSGMLTGIKVVNECDPLFEKEAIRIVKAMPDWESAKHFGMVVRSCVEIPVIFELTPGALSFDEIMKARGVMAEDDFDNGDEAQADGGETQADSTEQVYQVVEKMPEFPGGMEALLSFWAKNVKYPSAAMDLGIQGRVLVSFTIDTDGSIIDPKITKSVHPLLDAEAIRAILSMPKWKPGMRNGRPVKVKYNTPVAFRMTQ